MVFHKSRKIIKFLLNFDLNFLFPGFEGTLAWLSIKNYLRISFWNGIARFNGLGSHLILPREIWSICIHIWFITWQDRSTFSNMWSSLSSNMWSISSSILMGLVNSGSIWGLSVLTYWLMSGVLSCIWYVALVLEKFLRGIQEACSTNSVYGKHHLLLYLHPP